MHAQTFLTVKFDVRVNIVTENTLGNSSIQASAHERRKKYTSTC